MRSTFARRRRNPDHSSTAGGFQLIDLVVTTAIVAALSLVGIPPLLTVSAGHRVESAAAELVAVLRRARSLAIRQGVHVGVKFTTGTDGRVAFTLYRDGDGDGLSSRDIARGIDPPLGARERLAHLGSDVRFGFPDREPPRDPGDPRRRLRRLGDPVRFNRSDLASFGPLGTSTPGSLYVTDGRRQLAVVRVFGRTGKVRTLRYDYDTESWR